MNYGFDFANYGQERDRVATESELEMFETICSVLGREDLELVRKSDDYVSVVVGDWDLARIKFTPRAKWIVLPVLESGSKKHRIQEPGDVAEFADLIRQSLEHIEKYSG